MNQQNETTAPLVPALSPPTPLPSPTASSEDASPQARADAPHAEATEPKTGDKNKSSPPLSRHHHLAFTGSSPTSPPWSNRLSNFSSSAALEEVHGLVNTSAPAQGTPGTAGGGHVPGKDDSPSASPSARGGNGKPKPIAPVGGGAGGGGGDAAAAAAAAASGDEGEGGTGKMGLQLSALFVHRALMVFRRERAATVRLPSIGTWELHQLWRASNQSVFRHIYIPEWAQFRRVRLSIYMYFRVQPFIG